jgi:hypothetical protein
MEINKTQLETILYNKYPLIPGYMYKEIIDYVIYHLPLGEFLKCLIHHDIIGMGKNAKDENRKFSVHVQYVEFFTNDVPESCRWNMEKYQNWLMMKKQGE